MSKQGAVGTLLLSDFVKGRPDALEPATFPIVSQKLS